MCAKFYMKTPSKRRLLPLSGSEPDFGNARWSTEQGVRSNNCYSYAFNNLYPPGGQRNPPKAVPGDRSGSPYPPSFRFRSCKPVHERVLLDNPWDVYQVAPKARCKSGFYKAMMFVSSQPDSHGDEYGDFHFYRQDKDVAYRVRPGDTPESVARFFGIDPAEVGAGPLRPGSTLRLRNVGVFSHKLGNATKPLLHDSCGRAIQDPRKACRQHASIAYDKFCSAYCVRRGGAKTRRASAGGGQ